MKSPAEKIKRFRPLVTAFKNAQVIITSEELGIFRKIASGVSDLTALSIELNINKSALATLLNALVFNGILTRNGEVYTLVEEYDILDPKKPYQQNGYIHHISEVQKRWIHLGDAMRNLDEGHMNFAEITGQDNDATFSFLEAMHANALPQANYIANNYSFENRKILDIGAGSGVFSMTIARKYSTTQGTLLDLPNVLPVTQKFFNTTEFGDRFKVIGGSYLEPLPGDCYDDIFLFAVVHQEQDTEVKNLIKQAYSKLKSGGRLFLTSFFLNEDRVSPQFSVLFAVEMVVMVGKGKVYTHEEMNSYLIEAGFQEVERKNDIPGPATLFTALKK